MKTRALGNRALSITKSRWLAYAAASAASMTAGIQCAEGAIHYSGPLNVNVSGNGDVHRKFQLDQPGDAIAFEHLETFDGRLHNFAGFKAAGIVGGSFRGEGGLSYSYVNKLQRGEVVSKGSFNTAENLSGYGLLAGDVSGYFDVRGIGFIGFAFDGGAGKQYGWARVLMGGLSRGNGFRILDYAYADPGESIRVGQTSSDEPGRTTPTLGSLGLLAAGAAGLIAWRKQRSKMATE